MTSSSILVTFFRKQPVGPFLLLSLALPGLGAAPAGDGRGLTHIGTQKQLFIDDYIIQQTSHVMRILNPAVKASNNPIIEADRPWESNYLRCRKVFYDQKDGLFKMWYAVFPEFVSKKDGGDGYRTSWVREGDGFVRKDVPDPYGYGEPRGDQQVLCYATSRDGFHWEKPNLEGRWNFGDRTTTTSCRPGHPPPTSWTPTSRTRPGATRLPHPTTSSPVTTLGGSISSIHPTGSSGVQLRRTRSWT